MEIKTRLVCGKYIEVVVEIGKSRHDLGLFSKEDAKALAEHIESASVDIYILTNKLP